MVVELCAAVVIGVEFEELLVDHFGRDDGCGRFFGGCVWRGGGCGV